MWETFADTENPEWLPATLRAEVAPGRGATAYAETGYLINVINIIISIGLI